MFAADQAVAELGHAIPEYVKQVQVAPQQYRDDLDGKAF